MTGDGRGKTTSALGLVLRAVGHGMRVGVIQFMKQRGDTGEVRALQGLPGVEVHICGKGFVTTRAGAAFETHAQAARAGLRLAEGVLGDAAYGMVVLDEVCGAVAAGLLAVEDVVRAVRGAAPGIAIVLTGRDAAPELEALADTVSRIVCVKHGFDDGWPAQEGVEL